MVQATIRGVRVASLLLAGYWVAMFVGTHMPSVPVPRIDHIDKVFHFCGYTGLAFLLSWAIPTRINHPLMNVLIAGFCALLYGVFDEFTQIPVGRTADVFDWLADSAGTFTGLIAYVMLRALVRQVMERLDSSRRNSGAMRAAI